MRVVRISSKNYDGAGLCVQRLHMASLRIGIDEKLLVSEAKDLDKTIKVIQEDKHYVPTSFIEKMIHNVLVKLGLANKIDCLRYRVSLLQSHRWVLFTLPYTFYKSLAYDDDVRNADIINLHWVSDFVDIPSFLKNVKKPIVWSLHDENLLRGGLHYECDFPEYDSIEKKMQKVKFRAFAKAYNLHIVVQSIHVKKLCENSRILGRFPITVINNGVNVDDFHMIDKSLARELLGLPISKTIFIFSALYINDSRKGLDVLIKALEKIQKDILLICIGDYNCIPKVSFDIKCMGYISDMDLYSQLYSAADFYVLPSFQESFAKTVLESMACGTPVIAFPCSGTEDCIKDFNGVICEDFSVEALTDGLLCAMEHRYDAHMIRKYVENNFTFDKMARNYEKLYKNILGHK